MDYNPQVIEEARKGEYIYPPATDMSRYITEGYFEYTGGQRHRRFGSGAVPVIRATQNLKDKIDFRVVDISKGPVDGEYDIVVMNNVLMHFTEQQRRKILDNVLFCLKNGGLLVLEPEDNYRVASSNYKEWRRSFAKEFGLEEIPLKVSSESERTIKTGQYYQFKK